MILAVLAIGFILRLVNLNQSLWLDEAISVLAARSYSYNELLARFAASDVHPPLHYLLLRFWGSVVGFSEISMRMPSVIFGLIAVFFTYQIGKSLFNKKVAITAAIFLALNPLAVYYSQEARMYFLTAAAVTAGVFFFMKKQWPLFLLTFAIAVYSDYLAYFILPVFYFFTKDKKTILTAYAALLISYLPWLPTLWQQFSANTALAASTPAWAQVVGGISLKSLPLTLVKFIIGRVSISNKFLYGLTIFPVAAVYLFTLTRSHRRILWLWLLMPILTVFVLSLKVPIFDYHRFIFVLPAFILLLANGSKSKKLAVFIILVSIVSLMIFNLNPKFQRENWKGAVDYMESRGRLVLIPNLAQAAALNYYNKELIVRDRSNVNLANHQTVFLLRYVQEIFDPQDQERQVLEASGYKNTAQRNFNGVVVWEYRL